VHAAARVKEGHQAAASLFNAHSTYEVFSASSSSMATHNLAAAMAPTLSADDEIIVTNFDHEGTGSLTRPSR
jgi:selenocysteine lyase/cysteine desulfurase